MSYLKISCLFFLEKIGLYVEDDSVRRRLWPLASC